MFWALKPSLGPRAVIQPIEQVSATVTVTLIASGQPNLATELGVRPDGERDAGVSN